MMDYLMKILIVTSLITPEESIKSNIENDIKILHYCHGTHIAKILIISALKSLRERDILKSNLRDSILTGKKVTGTK